MYSADVCALICRRPYAASAPNSEIHCPNWTPKAGQLENRFRRSNLAARGRIAFKFHKMVLRSSVKKAEL